MVAGMFTVFPAKKEGGAQLYPGYGKSWLLLLLHIDLPYMFYHNVDSFIVTLRKAECQQSLCSIRD